MFKDFLSRWKMAKIVRVSIYFILVVLSLVLTNMSQLRFQNAFMKDPSGKELPVTLPYNELSPAGVNGEYVVTATVKANFLSPTWVQIIPDDKVTFIGINGQEISLAGIDPNRLADYRSGFSLPIGNYLHDGDNKVEIRFQDGGGRMGLAFYSVLKDAKIYALYLLLLVLFTLIFTEVMLATGLRRDILVLLVASLVIRVLYLMVTGPDVRGHDVGAHAAYVQYMGDHFRLPPVEWAAGGAWFHPPLYYAFGGIFHWIAMTFFQHNVALSNTLLQVLSIVFSMVFIWMTVLILRRVMDKFTFSKHDRDPNAYAAYPAPVRGFIDRLRGFSLFTRDRMALLFAALVAFWPSNIVHSVRIGNDDMMYMLYAIGFYNIIRWHESADDAASPGLMAASVVSGLAIITKSNSMVLFGILGVVFLLKFAKSLDWKKYLKLAIAPAIAFTLSMGIAYYPGVILKMQGKRERLFNSNIGILSPANLVGNTGASYFWFDAKMFVTEPFTSPFDDKMGRQYFWNYLGKTGLFGEFDYKPVICRNTAHAISFFFLLMFVYTAGGLFLMNKKGLFDLLPHILNFVLLWAAITYFRTTFPANIDFRYITPILISFSALYAFALQAYRKKGWFKLEVLGYAFAVIFIALSILFFGGLISAGA